MIYDCAVWISFAEGVCICNKSSPRPIKYGKKIELLILKIR
jgi:hypothetical protein